jgi:hypothetical protein
MNLQDLMSKLKAIEENATPGATSAGGIATVPTPEETVEECGEMPGAIIHAGGAMPQQDNVTMNVSLNGSGAGGVRDLMDVLRNIEQSAEQEPLIGEPHQGHDDSEEEPLIGDMVAAMGHAMGADGAEVEMDETMDDHEDWGNSAPGGSPHHVSGVDAVTVTGDDMNSKGKLSPLARAPGTNAMRHPMHEEVADRLQQLYNSIKEERTEEKDEKGNVVRWKEEGEWTKAKKDSDPSKSGRGKVTNLSDKARRESEKLEKKETVKESKELNDIIALTKILKG